MVCAYDLAYVFGMMFFTVAILLNAIRWVVLISDLQNIRLTTYSFKTKLIMGGMLLWLLVVSIFRMVAEC